MSLVKYHVRWRHIPLEERFTPMYHISIEHTQVEAKENASEYDIKLAISSQFESLNIKVDDIRIESVQKI